MNWQFWFVTGYFAGAGASLFGFLTIVASHDPRNPLQILRDAWKKR